MLKLTAAATGLALSCAIAAAQDVKPNDAQIAHIAYTAGQIDIKAAELALQKSKQKEVREFAARRLADFKVPRKVLFLPEIPKGATGKLQRIGLAAKLGLT